MTLGEKIQQLRKLRGMSQEQLAERLNVSRQSISKWELNDTIPDLSKIIMLSKFFSISTDELIKENFSLKENLEAENSNRNDNILVIQDDLFDDYIGKVCSVDMTGWNDGVNNAYLVSYDNYFLYYILCEKKQCKIGALGKKYIKEIKTEKVKNHHIPKTEQIDEIGKEFFVTKKVNLYLDDKHFWSGLIGKDTEYLDLTVRKLDYEKIVVSQNVNEFTVLFCDIAKIEINVPTHL